MKVIEFILAKINGKKTTIATICGAIITFCLARNYIEADTAQLLSTILVALGFGANYLNARNK